MPAQFATIAATLTWLAGAADAGGLSALASLAGSLWAAAISPTGPLASTSAARRAAVIALHCAAAAATAQAAGELTADLCACARGRKGRCATLAAVRDVRAFTHHCSLTRT